MYRNLKVLAVVIGCISCANFFKLSNNIDEQPDNEAYSRPECYNKLVGSEGFVQIPAFPHKYLYSTACEWDFDVKEGFVVEFEVESFRLPFSKEKSCSSYVEISYANQQDEIVNRRFCPTDTVDRVHTGSQTAHILFKSGEYREEYGNHSYGFKINYRAVTTSSPAGDKQAVTLVLLSFAILIVLALCVCCIWGRSKSTGNTYSLNIIPQQHNSRGLSIRSDLETALEVQQLQRYAPQNEKKYPPFSIFQSKTPVDSSNALTRDLGVHHSAPSLKENRKISIATTPRSCLPRSNKLWNSESARRIQQVKTRLVSRFSSNSSEDTSIYFDVLDFSRYSQLKCEDESSPEEPVKEPERPKSNSHVVPSIVIQFME